MKLLLDQGLPRSSASILRNANIDTVHVGEIGMAMAEDWEILEQSRQEQRIVVTLDADFHALLALSRAKSPSVVRIRIEGLRGEGLAVLIQRILIAASAQRFTAVDAYERGISFSNWIVGSFICCNIGDTRQAVINTAMGANDNFPVRYAIEIVITAEEGNLPLFTHP